MMKRKRLIVFLVAVSMMIASMFTGMPVSAASETEADTVFAEAELMGKKTCTIKKKSSKYYYVNAKGKTTKKKGWQKNASGDYTYFVGSKGYVTAKITNGNYYKWKSGRFVRISLSKYKGKTVKLKGKTFYVKTNGKISKTKGWKKNTSGDYAYYIGEKGNVTAKITKGKYYKSKSDGFVLATLSGRATTAKLNSRYFYINTNGKIVISAGWKKNASGTYAYYVSANGSVTAKLSGGGYFQYASGKFTKKSLAAYKGKTIKIHGLSVAVSEDGTASVAEKTQSADDNSKDDADSGKKDDSITNHVHQWSFKDANGNMLEDTNCIEHPAETRKVYTKIRDAYDEPVYEERAVCRKCGAIFPTYVMDGLDAWYEHSDETNHGNFEYTDVIVDYNHYDAEYDWVEVVDKEAWSEWDQNYRCTVCEDTMKIHASSESGSVIHIPEKSGDVLDFYGKVSRTVTTGVPY